MQQTLALDARKAYEGTSTMPQSCVSAFYIAPNIQMKYKDTILIPSAGVGKS